MLGGVMPLYCVAVAEHFLLNASWTTPIKDMFVSGVKEDGKFMYAAHSRAEWKLLCRFYVAQAESFLMNSSWTT